MSIVWTANIDTLVCCSLLVDTPDGYMLHEWWKVGCTVQINYQYNMNYLFVSVDTFEFMTNRVKW